MKWIETARQSSTPVDIVAVVIAALPVVYRISQMIRELQPEIRDWLRASAERARTDVHTADAVVALVQQVARLSEDMREADVKMAERLEHQDAALVKLLQTIVGDGDE